MTYSPKRARLFLGICVGIPIAAGALTVALHVGRWGAMGLLTAAVLISLCAAWAAFQHWDEIQRETDLRAWYWGSALGMAGAGILTLILLATGSVPGLVDAIFHSQQPKPGGYFASGVCVSILLQFIGWLVVRAAGILRKGERA